MDTPITRAQLQSAQKNLATETMIVKIRRTVLEEAQEGRGPVIFRVDSHFQEVLERVRTIFPDCTVIPQDDTFILVDWS